MMRQGALLTLAMMLAANVAYGAIESDKITSLPGVYPMFSPHVS